MVTMPMPPAHGLRQVLDIGKRIVLGSIGKVRGELVQLGGQFGVAVGGGRLGGALEVRRDLRRDLLILGGVRLLQLLERTGERGEEVLVIGAGSGVGSAAIQVAKLVNARVIATAGADWKLEKARALGADEVVNHTRQSISEEVKRLTSKRGVDVVVDHVGAAVWEACFNSLANYGRLVTCGMTTGADLKLNGQGLFGRQRTILGSFMGGKGELADALKVIGQGKLKAVIDSVFPLQEAAAAQEKMVGREFFGKILLHP